MDARTARPTLRSPLAALLVALPALGSLAACSGGGASAGGGGSSAVDEGAYEPDAFGYSDPHPTGFHPLATDSTTLEPLDELALFVPSASGLATSGRLLEDARAGTAVAGDPFAALPPGAAVACATTGQVDDDAAVELLVGTLAGDLLTVRVLETVPGGVEQTASFDVPGAVDATLHVGDFDGDQRDELVVASLAGVRVYDDQESGFALLLDRTLGPGAFGDRLHVLPVDLDGDGRDEMVWTLAGNSNVAWSLVLGDGGAPADGGDGFAELFGWDLLKQGVVGARPVAGDFDGDGTEDLVVSYTTPFESIPASARQYEFDADHGLVLDAFLYLPYEWLVPAPFSDPEQHWDVAVLDRDADGVDELAFLLVDEDVAFPSLDHELHVVVVERAGAGWATALDIEVDEVSSSYGARLAAADTDADGASELYLGVTEGSAAQLALRRFDWSGGPVVTELPLAPFAASGSARAPLLVPGDFDADGLVLRATGVKRLQVADPIPLVLLTAPPTQAGAAQNHGGSSTAYTESTGSGESIGVTTEATYSASVGVAGPLSSLFGIGAKTTLELAFAKSRVESATTTLVQGFGGGYEDDVVVFQGTLYHSYEYEVVSALDPDAVGTYLTIDLPVATKTYKWTVTKYDTEFGAEHALAPALLPHTVGDVASYRSRAEVEALLATDRGWMDAGTSTVGEGTGANSTSIELAQETTSTEETSFAVTDELSFSASVATATVSYGLKSSRVYSVTTSLATGFTGTVGDLQGDDWNAWQYDFGLAVYQRGVPSAGGVPTATPLHVVTYWTAPHGAAY